MFVEKFRTRMFFVWPNYKITGNIIHIRDKLQWYQVWELIVVMNWPHMDFNFTHFVQYLVFIFPDLRNSRVPCAVGFNSGKRMSCELVYHRSQTRIAWVPIRILSSFMLVVMMNKNEMNGIACIKSFTRRFIFSSL